VAQCPRGLGQHSSACETDPVRKAIPVSLYVRHLRTHSSINLNDTTRAEGLIGQIVPFQITYQAHSRGVLRDYGLCNIAHPRAKCDTIDNLWVDEPD
jgi:hypothetical protein